MKTPIIYLITIVLIVFAACTKDDEPQSGEKVKVSFNVEAEPNTFLKSGIYDRGTAPAYIDGLHISYRNISQYFEFADEGTPGEPITIDLLSGQYEFLAATHTSNSGNNIGLGNYYDLTNELPDDPGEADLNAELSRQLSRLVGRDFYDNFFAYFGTENPVQAIIQANGNNSVNLHLKALTGRVVVIFMNNDNTNGLEFFIEGKTYEPDQADPTIFIPTDFDNIDITHDDYEFASVLIFNQYDVVEGNRIQLTIYKKLKGSSDDWELASEDIIIDVENAVVKNHLIYYNGKENTTKMSFTYDDFVFTKSIVEI